MSTTNDSEDWLDAAIEEALPKALRVVYSSNLKRKLLKDAVLAHYAHYLKPEDVEGAVDTPELRQLMAENKRLIEAGDALYECASYTGREFDGTHRLLSAAAHWLDVRGKNSGAYQAQLSKLNREEKKDAKT